MTIFDNRGYLPFSGGGLLDLLDSPYMRRAAQDPEIRSGVQGLVGNPKFSSLLMNLGMGLLANSGPRPISQGPPSFGAGLAQGLSRAERQAREDRRDARLDELAESRLSSEKLSRSEIERRRRKAEKDAVAYQGFQSAVIGTPPGAAYDAGVAPVAGGLLNAPQPGFAPDSPEYRQALGGLLGTPYGSTALGLLSKQPTAPSGYAYNQGGLAPIPGGPADPRRQTLPPSGYAYGAGDRLAPVPGGPADPSRPAAPPSGYTYGAGGRLEMIPGGPADKAPTSRTRIQGNQSIVEEYRNGKWEKVSSGPRKVGAGQLTTAQIARNRGIDNSRKNLSAALGVPPGPAFTQELQRRMQSTDPITGLPNVDYNSHIAKLAWEAAQSKSGDDEGQALWQRQITGLFPPGFKGPDKGSAVDMPRTSGGRPDRSKLMKGRSYRTKHPGTGEDIIVKWNGREFERVR